MNECSRSTTALLVGPRSLWMKSHKWSRNPFSLGYLRSPKLHRHLYTSLPGMDACSCCGSAWIEDRSGHERAYSKRSYCQLTLSLTHLITGSKLPSWRILWKKIRGKKRRVSRWSSCSFRVPYDAFTYAQNFDQGSTWADPDALSRSFSARFAVPSRIFQQTAGVATLLS